MNMSPKNIIDFLRLADKEIKNSNLETAMGYINKIFELEQKNVYAKAYKERIISLMEGQGLSRADAEHKAARSKLAEPPAAANNEQPIPAAVEPEHPAPKPVAQQNTVAIKSEPVVAPIPVRENPKQQQQPSPQGKYSQIRRSAAASEAYKALLMEIWKDGLVSPDEQSRIDSMRETFAITAEEHAVIEKDVRLTCYLHSIRDEWRKGITDFSPQRRKFFITDQEQLALEPKVFQLLQSLQSNGSVLVLDDEDSFLNIIKGVLHDGGFYCFTSTTGEEGLQLLETMTPDIVVCDINFSKPNMSGFAFYEKFRSIDKFLTTPFIFLSGLDQDVLVRTGKKLGADDYLFKPIDAEMLLATIEGKLRRSRELKRIL
jgi:CheY-like chemotaxis protein